MPLLVWFCLFCLCAFVSFCVLSFAFLGCTIYIGSSIAQ
jgi:hypothetical protein